MKQLLYHRAYERRAVRVLIVDDDFSLTSMLTLHLRDAGVRVISAGNCRDTFAILKTGAFDVALVDYQLPDGNGLEVVSLLRQAFPRVRLIMMSGSEEPLVSHHRLGMQVCDFLKKPFSGFGYVIP